eukprot:Em0002g225a
MQKPGEQLVEFAGELRVLADRAYPRWSSEHRQEALRNQFMQGVRSSSIQLRLMKEMPPTLDDALKLASQLEAVEEAQKRLQKDRCKTESLALTDDTVADPDSCTSNATSGPGQQQYERESLEKRLSRQLRQAEADVQKLSTQVQQLLKESTMNTRRRPANSRDNTGQKRTDGPVCWGCGKKGHVKRDCPQRRTAFKNHLPSESAAVSASLFIYGFLEGHRTKMLVDTGSAVTIIRRDIWDGISRKQLETPVRAVLAANGNEISLSGQGDVLVQVGDLSVRHNVLVADCLTQDCILGSDFLLLHGCVIDLLNHSLLVKGKVVPLSSGIYHSPISTCGVAVAETVEVPAHSQFRLIANRQGKKKEQGVDDLGSVMFEPSHDFMESHGLAVAHAVVGEDNEDIVVQILNPTPYSVQVQQGSRIGCLRPLLDVCAIELEAVARQGDNRSHARECIIHQLVSCAQGVTQKERQQLTDLLTEFESILSDREDDLGRTHLVYHKIDTGDAVPIRQSARRLPYFQREERLMEQVLAGLHWSTCLVYLDDIIVFSRTVADHLDQLRDVFTRLKNAGLTLKPSKCHLLQMEGFAQVAAPLNALTNKGKEWMWTADCTHAFLELKKRLVSTPVLVMPQFTQEFILDTDASGEGLGAVLSQVIEGEEKVVAYASKTLTRTERKYCATRREMLALVWATHHFRPYLYGHRFVLRTDHSALQWLHNFKEPEGQTARWLEQLAEYNYRVVHRPGRHHTNADSLSRMPCKQCGLSEASDGTTCCDAVVQHEIILPTWTPEEMQSAQQTDVALSKVIDWFESNSIPHSPPTQANLRTLWLQRDQLMLKEGVLYRQWKDVPGGGLHKRLQLVLPASLVPGVLSGLHDTPVGGHLGVKKTLEKVQMRFYWPSQKKDVEKWCASCAKCSSRKSPLPTRAPLQLEDSVSRPLERIAMDIVGPLPVTERGNRYILVVGDYFTRWKEAYPMKDMEAQTVACILVNEFICRLGVPDTIHTDQGRNFESKLIKELCQMLGIKKTRTTPYHPQSDGMVERFNRTLLNMLSIAVGEDEMSWDLQLPLLLLAYRTSVHDTTGTSPFELMYGREVRLPEDIMFALPATVETARADYKGILKRRLQHAYQLVRKHTRRQQEHQKFNYDRSIRGQPFQVGDLVLLHCPHVPRGRSPKLHRPWQGPFKVMAVLGPATYHIVNCARAKKRLVVHFNRLKPWVSNESMEGPPSLPKVSPNSMENEHQPTITSDKLEDVVLYFPQPQENPLVPGGDNRVEGEDENGQEIQAPGLLPPQDVVDQDLDVHDEPAPELPALRRSTRIRHPPGWYGDRIVLPDTLA